MVLEAPLGETPSTQGLSSVLVHTCDLLIREGRNWNGRAELHQETLIQPVEMLIPVVDWSVRVLETREEGEVSSGHVIL